MELKKPHSRTDHAPAGNGASRLSRRQDPGPLFDLPPVDPSQQAAFLRLMSGFHAEGVSPDELDVAAVSRVLSTVYEPRRRCWRDLEANTVLEAVGCYAPDLRAAREQTTTGGYVEFVLQIECIVFMLQFLERCAERLRDTPADARPAGEAATWQWLHDDFAGKGEIRSLKVLEGAGESVMKFALRMVRIIERAPAISPGLHGRPRRGRAKRHPA